MILLALRSLDELENFFDRSGMNLKITMVIEYGGKGRFPWCTLRAQRDVGSIRNYADVVVVVLLLITGNSLSSRM